MRVDVVVGSRPKVEVGVSDGLAGGVGRSTFLKVQVTVAPACTVMVAELTPVEMPMAPAHPMLAIIHPGGNCSTMVYVPAGTLVNVCVLDRAGSLSSSSRNDAGCKPPVTVKAKS